MDYCLELGKWLCFILLLLLFHSSYSMCPLYCIQNSSEGNVLIYSIVVFLFPGGKIVSSKPFAPLNFRINSRNLSGKYRSSCKSRFQCLMLPWIGVWYATCHMKFHVFSLFCRYWHNNACGGAFSTQGLRVLDWKASVLLPAYHRPHHSKHWSCWRRTQIQRVEFIFEESLTSSTNTLYIRDKE